VGDEEVLGLEVAMDDGRRERMEVGLKEVGWVGWGGREGTLELKDQSWVMRRFWDLRSRWMMGGESEWK
jgi:hypothetical protein